MIALEEKEQKYSREKHKARLEVILENYEKIMDAINEELPPLSEMEKLLDEIKLPKTLTEIGVDESLLSTTFRATKDIRDKYVLSRLAWDLGVEEKLLKGE